MYFHSSINFILNPNSEHSFSLAFFSLPPTFKNISEKLLYLYLFVCYFKALTPVRELTSFQVLYMQLHTCEKTVNNISC